MAEHDDQLVVLRDVVITHTRRDVPADVVEAIGLMLAKVALMADDLDVLCGDDPAAAELVRESRRRARAAALDRWAASRSTSIDSTR